jgi:hypothetical protein
MKRLFLLLTSIVLLQACTYHHKLPRGLFAAPVADERIHAAVLLASDKIAQKQFVLKDYHSQNSVHSYKIDLADGSLTATAEALATLFDTVEVNPAKYANKYDYQAQLTYTVSNTRTDNIESVQWFGGQPPIVETQVMIEIFDTRTGKKVFSMFASRYNRVEMTDATAVTQRLENKGTTLFLPFTGPVYTQQFGDDLKYTLSRDLSQCLSEIAEALQQNAALFAPRTQNNVK